MDPNPDPDTDPLGFLSFCRIRITSLEVMYPDPTYFRGMVGFILWTSWNSLRLHKEQKYAANINNRHTGKIQQIFWTSYNKIRPERYRINEKKSDPERYQREKVGSGSVSIWSGFVAVQLQIHLSLSVSSAAHRPQRSLKHLVCDSAT